VFTGSVATLTGAGSSDPDGDAITYQWAFTSMPAGSAAGLSAAASVAPSFTADIAGAYVLSLTVTDPAGLSSTASVTVNAFTPATVTVTAPGNSASESGAAGSFTFTRSGSTAAALVVRYGVGGTATNAADYARLPGWVTIAAGQASASVVVTAVNDTEFEGSETVDVTLQPDGAYTVGSPSAATVTIADNDRPTVTIVATDAAASESGDPAVFTISRTGPTTASLRVTFNVTGTALATTDYAALGNTVFIPAGSSTVTLTVVPVADAVSDPDEYVNVSLIANSGVTIGSPASARVFISEP
jgi:hypothetical protein